MEKNLQTKISFSSCLLPLFLSSSSLPLFLLFLFSFLISISSSSLMSQLISMSLSNGIRATCVGSNSDSYPHVTTEMMLAMLAELNSNKEESQKSTISMKQKLTEWNPKNVVEEPEAVDQTQKWEAHIQHLVKVSDEQRKAIHDIGDRLEAAEKANQARFDKLEMMMAQLVKEEQAEKGGHETDTPFPVGEPGMKDSGKWKGECEVGHEIDSKLLSRDSSSPNSVIADCETSELDLDAESITVSPTSVIEHTEEGNIDVSLRIGDSFKANLPDGSALTVKRLNVCVFGEKQFKSEMNRLGELRHPNLMPLLDYCVVEDERLLVYKYMPNRRLLSQMHNSGLCDAILDWPTRLMIGVGAARGLAWLHHGCQPLYLHQLISSNAILLDDFDVRIPDYGLARLVGSRDSNYSSFNNGNSGKLGYVAHENPSTMIASLKGDIYGVSIVLLEEQERISHIPGEPINNNVSFSQFSGYITVHESAGRALLYCLIESLLNLNPESKPLVLSLNDGPGFSSLALGAAEDIRPFKINPDGKTLYHNPYSWNQLANLLFLESPTGVGFSYSNTTSDLYTAGDKRTAEEVYMFLVKWFERFPQHKHRDFYIARESYAGHYVPQLLQIVYEEQNRDIHFKSFVVGNVMIDDYHDFVGTFEYWWAHGLISDITYHNLKNICEFVSSEHPTPECIKALDDADSEQGNIDPYSIYTITFQQEAASLRSCFLWVCHPWMWRVYDPCTESDIVGEKWANSPLSMLLIYKEIITAGIRIWVFSGDTDFVVPAIGTRYSIRVLKLPPISEWYPWNDNGQVGEVSIHRDLKPSNILLGDNMRAKVADMGDAVNILSSLVDLINALLELSLSGFKVEKDPNAHLEDKVCSKRDGIDRIAMPLVLVN